MKLVKVEVSDEIYSMTKLREKLSDVSRVGNIPDFIYFSESLVGYSPRIKFYGGTSETSRTTDCPSMLMSKECGAYNIEVLPWHNKKNCPYAFDKAAIRQLSTFVNKNLCLLLLTWFRKLDEAYTLKYFEGSYSLNQLLNKLTDASEDLKNQMLDCNDLESLHEICKENELYSFDK